MDVNKVYCGKMEIVLKDFPDNCCDSIVTDPPYGISFMNKHWDYNVPTVEQWKEAFRVLKHGGYLLCACGTRTQHRMVVNIEDAGFEIRDVITWHYGSGFPKSLDVSKAIDKTGNRYEFFDRIRLFLTESLKVADLSFKDINERMGFATNGSGMAGHWFGNITQQTLPTKKQWFELKIILNFSDEFDEPFNKCVSPNERPIIGVHKNPAKEIYQSGELSKDVLITSASSEAAKQWEGYGTALKPATEFWTLCRKPISEKTVAENVLKWGTGGLNIDGCRINFSDNEPDARVGTDKISKGASKAPFETGKSDFDNPMYKQGRFPANVILDEFMGEELDKQSGILTTGKMTGVINNTKSPIGEFGLKPISVNVEASEGGASRYFFNANGGIDVFFTYFYNLIKTEISCGNILENQKIVGIVNGVTLEIEKCFHSAGLFTDGNKSTVSCQSDTKFTTETLIRLMIELKTCNALQGMNIEWFTQEQMKTIKLLMELNIETAKNVKSINYLMNLHLEMLELIRDIVNRVHERNYKNGEIPTEQSTTNIISNIENARFRYCPKPDNFERNKGLKNFALGEPPASARSKPAEGRENALGRPRQNHHPTVKPIDLMRYLVRLVTPKGGICLDPYCGSGTTLIAAKMELMNYIGIDMDETHIPLAEARVKAWNPDLYKPQQLF